MHTYFTMHFSVLLTCVDIHLSEHFRSRTREGILEVFASYLSDFFTIKVFQCVDDGSEKRMFQSITLISVHFLTKI